MHGGRKRCFQVLVGRPECKRSLGRPRHRWEDNIKLDHREIGMNGVNWIQLAQDGPMVGFCEHGNKPLGSIKKAGYF
jgi:hypothetical protein